ncbi:MAG: hypothetical protein KDD69_15580 [Bdellovibrionales bacterium]|nr:hypothetical protein [Bdellovibrionales bacterium]
MQPPAHLLAAFAVNIPCDRLLRRLVEIKPQLISATCSPDTIRLIDELIVQCRVGACHVAQYIFGAKLLVQQGTEEDFDIARDLLIGMLPVLLFDCCSQIDRQCADRRDGCGVPFGPEVTVAREMLVQLNQQGLPCPPDFFRSPQCLKTLEQVANYFERETKQVVLERDRPLVQRYVDTIRTTLSLVETLW